MATGSKRGLGKKNAGVMVGETVPQYFERWKWLGPLLDSIRHDELRAMSETDYFQAVERVWSVNVRRSLRRESGLVEFQKALRR